MSSLSFQENQLKKLTFVQKSLDDMSAKVSLLEIQNQTLKEENEVLRYNNRRIRAKNEAIFLDNKTNQEKSLFSFFTKRTDSENELRVQLQLFEDQLNKTNFQNGLIIRID